MEKDEDKKLQIDIEESQHTTLPCMICNVETYGRGVFTASEKGTLGAPKDSYRIIIFPLCQQCSYRVGYMEEVKRRILREYN